MKKVVCLLLLLLGFSGASFGQTPSGWRAAKPEELEGILPARAPVEKERIETEMRTATGIINDHGQVIAAVVLITAGYAADGKYSHYLLAQAPFTLGTHSLPAGAYVVGWKHADDGLQVRVFDAASGVERGSILAKPIPVPKRVESFRIWPPSERSIIQIGRYMLPYTVAE